MEEKQTEEYKVLLKGGQGEITEKKSRFIATLQSCSTEEEAERFIAEIKKQYWDARHNCSAFVIGSRGEITRCSDDGEPSGTAGRPMLEVLIKENIRNVAVVVTRYFGGTLLGTGGLVRAYTQAVKEGLANSVVGNMQYGYELELVTDYNDVGRILYILGQLGLAVLESSYTEVVRLVLKVPKECVDALLKELTDTTGGRVEIARKDGCYFVS